MKRKCPRLTAILVFAFVVSAMTTAAAPVLVLRHPNLAAPLADRWEWAFGQAGGPDCRNGFWAGYSIRRKMSEHSFIGCWNWPPRNGDRTLEDVIAGVIRPPRDRVRDEQAVKVAARKALDEIEGRSVPDRIVDKDIAILLKFGPSAGRTPSAVEICDVRSLFDPKGLPLLWLGPASDKDSLAVLDRFYSGPAGVRIKQDFIQAVGLHQSPGLAVPFLAGAVVPTNPEALRREAAEALGDQDDPRAVEILRRLAGADVSTEVRREAVSALAECKAPTALDALIEAALKSPDEDVRREAMDGLAEKASARAVQTLDQAAFSDPDTEVQKEAVSALAELPRSEALPHLAKVARTHANPEVRRAAISALGDLGGAEAIAILADLARGKK